MNSISPIDFDDQWLKKMFTWDISMHQSSGRYDDELNSLPNFEERKAKTTLDKNNWIAYMKLMNYLCSFYAFLYLDTAEKNVSLISSPIYLFPEETVKWHPCQIKSPNYIAEHKQKESLMQKSKE